jgi:hypothetical protein
MNNKIEAIIYEEPKDEMAVIVENVRACDELSSLADTDD